MAGGAGKTGNLALLRGGKGDLNKTDDLKTRNKSRQSEGEEELWKSFLHKQKSDS